MRLYARLASTLRIPLKFDSKNRLISPPEPLYIKKHFIYTPDRCIGYISQIRIVWYIDASEIRKYMGAQF